MASFPTDYDVLPAWFPAVRRRNISDCDFFSPPLVVSFGAEVWWLTRSEIVRSTMGIAQPETHQRAALGPNGNEKTSVAAKREPVLVVEVPDERVGLSLIDHLFGFHAELGPLDDTHFTVRVELRDRTLDALIDVFKLVRRWQSCVGLQTLRARLGSRVYTLSAT